MKTEYELSYTPAANSDIDYLLALRLDTMEEHLVAHGIHLSLAQHRERVEHEFGSSHLINCDDRRIGVLKVLHSESCIEILQLQIQPSDQGKGYGQAVLQDVIVKAATNGKLLKLSVLKKSPALELYSRAGFRIVAEDEQEYQMVRDADC